MKTNSRVGKKYLAVAGQIKVNNFRLISQDIQTWKTAIEAAKSINNPDRKRLYQMYDNIVLDGHLDSVMEKRTMAITNQRLKFIEDGKEGENNDFITDNVLQTPWFYDFLKLSMKHVSHGHVLIELIPQAGLIRSVEEIPRENVMPEKQLLLWDANNRTDGFNYEIDPVYSKYLVEVGGRKNLGKLIIAAQYIIYKRGGFGDWAQFAELFGMPFRVGKYDPYDDNTRRQLDEALREMGGASHITLPEGASIEFHDNNQAGKSEVFENLIATCNSEVSKLFLGQTMTTDDGSSRSQSEVHKTVEEEINIQDMIQMEYMLNWNFKNKLVDLGYPLEHGKFQFPETSQIPLAQRIDMDLKLSSQVYIDDAYWYETYGIPKPENSPEQKLVVVDPEQEQEVEEEQENKEEKFASNKKDASPKASLKRFNIDSEIKMLYKHKCDTTCADKHNWKPVNAVSGDKIWNRVSKEIHEGKIKPGQIDQELYLWIASELFKGVTSGFGGDFNDFYTNEPDRVMLANLEKNVHVFSAFKTYHELREATNALVDDKGMIRPFSEFQASIKTINEKYNKNWLQTEYNQAVASSQMASNWVDIQANAQTMPLLQYRTAGDSNVRASHDKLDGIIKPVNDSFWDSYYPPNDWGCRCEVVQISKGKITETQSLQIPELKTQFDNNSAKKGVVFPKSHPYFKVFEQDKEAAKNNFGAVIPDKNKE